MKRAMPQPGSQDSRTSGSIPTDALNYEKSSLPAIDFDGNILGTQRPRTFGGRRMKRLFKLVPYLLISCLLVLVLATPGLSIRRHRRHYRHNPEAGKAKAAKRIGVGAAIGGAAGGLIGGRKGALIGAGAGAGAGTAYHVHKKRQWRRRHPR